MADTVPDNVAKLDRPPELLSAAKKRADKPSRAGQWVVAIMFAVGLGASLFAWVWRKTQTDDCLAFWGAENAAAIRAGEKITLMRLGDSGLHESALPESVLPKSSAPPGIILPSGMMWLIEETRDISQAKGITHARRAFIEDSGFDWSSLAESEQPKRLDYAVRFQRGSAPPVTVGIDLAGSRFYHVESGRSLRAHEKMVQGWKEYAGRQFAAENGAPPREARSGD